MLARRSVRVAWPSDKALVGNAADWIGSVIGIGCGETVGTGLTSKDCASGGVAGVAAPEVLTIDAGGVPLESPPAGWIASKRSLSRLRCGWGSNHRSGIDFGAVLQQIRPGA